MDSSAIWKETAEVVSMIFGTTNRNRLSRFAEEIPSELLEFWK